MKSCNDFSLAAMFSLQDTNEIVAIKKFKDSEGKRALLSDEDQIIREHFL